MLPFNTVRSVTALAALAAAAAFGQLAAGSAAASDLAGVCGYEAPVITTTTLVLDQTTVQVGQGTTAHATVTAGDKTPAGSVTFAVAGTASQTVTLAGGKASYAVPSTLVVGAYQVTATAAPTGCFTPSSDAVVLNVVAPLAPSPSPSPTDTETPKPSPSPTDTETPPTVLPTEDVDDDDEDEVAGVSRPAPTAGILPTTGMDTGVQTAALAGTALVAAGAVMLIVHRRRKTAVK